MPLNNSRIRDTSDILNTFYPKVAVLRANGTAVKFYFAFSEITAQDRVNYYIVEPIEVASTPALYGSTNGFSYVVSYQKPVAAIAPTPTAPLQTFVATPVAAVQKRGIIIPFYIYPSNAFTNPDYDNIINLAKTYPEVPITVIINNANGAGAAVDLNFSAAIKRLHGADIKILGYVDSSFTTIPLATVEAEVDKWKSFYPEVDGIFVDQQTNDDNAVHSQYYVDLTTYVHSKGFFPCIANPGSPTLERYFKEHTADVILTWENNYYPDEATQRGNFQGGYSDYSIYKRGALVHSQAILDMGQLQLLSKYNGYIYITNNTLPNPWNTVSPYTEETIRALSEKYFIPDEFSYVSAALTIASAALIEVSIPITSDRLYGTLVRLAGTFTNLKVELFGDAFETQVQYTHLFTDTVKEDNTKTWRYRCLNSNKTMHLRITNLTTDIITGLVVTIKAEPF